MKNKILARYLNLIFIILYSSSITKISTYVISNDNNYTEEKHFNTNRIVNVIKSTLDVLYLVPEHLDNDILVLNEKHTFGNEYDKGWILPSEEPLSLFLYIYYDGHDESKLRPFIGPDNQINGSSSNMVQSSATLYLFFTPDNNCEDYLKQNHWPVKIVERIASHMFKAKLSMISLVYSSKPLHICMQQFDTDDNIHDQYRFYSHQGSDYWLSIITTKSLIPTWARIVLFIILLSLSGLFSGLNLGLMSLDLSELEILKRIGTPYEKSYASKIYPLRKRGNFLLCTILLGNVLVNSVSTLILGDMLSGIYAAFGSTILIVIFGEIIPQSACSKHGLAVGANTRYITYLFMVLTSPLSFPLSIVLDKVLGKEIPTTYNRERISQVMNNVEGLDDKEKRLISGALEFNKKKLKDVMTKIENVFMLEINSNLNFETIAEISKQGFSRIPIYEGTRDNIKGLLHVKDFALLDPDDNMLIRDILNYYNHEPLRCDAEESIEERFEEFRKGQTHLVFVEDVVTQEGRDPEKKCIGIVTLEDILEELVQMEIYDEFDDKKEIELENFNEKMEADFNNNNELKKTNSVSASLKNEQSSISQSYESRQNTLNEQETNFQHPVYDSQTSKDFSFFLKKQDSMSQRAPISPQIRFVVFQFLFTTVKPFTSEFLNKAGLECIFSRATFRETRKLDQKNQHQYLYKYGKECNYFVLILSGEAIIEAGKEKLEFSAGPFAYFGVNALLCGCENVDQILEKQKKKEQPDKYIPDFSLRLNEKCVYMRIDRDVWQNGIIKSRLKNNDENNDILEDLLNEQDITSESEYNQRKESVEIPQPLHNFFPFKSKNNSKPRNLRSSSIAVCGLNKLEEANKSLKDKQSETSKVRKHLFKQKLNQLKEFDDDLEDVSLSHDENLNKNEKNKETEPFISRNKSSS